MKEKGAAEKREREAEEREKEEREGGCRRRAQMYNCMTKRMYDKTVE